MKSFVLLFILISFAVEAQFSSETVKKIDTIENNTATDITINPTNQVVIPYLTSGELLINYGTGLQSFANGTEDQIIAIVGGIPTYIDQPVSLPDQSGNSGKYLFTDGTDASWEVVEALPDQTGNAGKFLGTDGTNESWETVNTAVTLQDAYDEAGQPQITVDGTNLGLQIRDAAVSIADFLFEVSNNALDTFYFAVDSTWAYIQGQPIVVADDSALDGEFVVRDSTESNGYKYTASLQGKLNPVTDTVDGVCTSTHTTNVTTTCKYSRLGDKAIIEWKNTYTGTTNTANLEFSMPDGLVIDAAKVSGTVSTVSIIGKGTAINDGGSSYPISVVYIDSTNVGARIANSTFTYAVNTNRVNATTPVNALSTSDSVVYSAILPIQNWTSGLDSAVQDIQLTAATANELSARISSVGVIDSFNYDFIQSASWSGGDLILVWKSGIFTEAPSVTAIDAGNGWFTNYNAISSTGATIRITSFNGGNTAYDVHLKVSKQGADVNKSQVIAGTFENIDSTDLCQVTAQGNNGAAQPANSSLSFTEIKDNCSVWDGSTFTAPRDGLYNFGGSVSYTANLTGRVRTYKNGSTQSKSASVSTNSSVRSFNAYETLNEGDTINITFEVAGTLLNNTVRHHLTITEMPSYEAIVKNLYQDSTTECETKYLQADVSTSPTTPSDLQFTGLVIGKKYSVNLRMRANFGSTNQTFILARNNLTDVCVVNPSGVSGLAPMSSSICSFVATDTAMDTFVSFASATATVMGNGTLTESNVTLCKLRDTTILN